jgi:hypothetical protein
MQYTEPTLALTTPQGHYTIRFADLRAALTSIPDPRRRQGRRYSLVSLLLLTLAALLCNHLSPTAIVEWGRDQPPDVQAALGFGPRRLPHQTTLQRLLRRLDPGRVAAAVQAYFDPPRPPDEVPGRGMAGVALDGKCQRGRLPFAPAERAPIHELNAYSAELGILLAQLALNALGDKASAELAAAPELLTQLNWTGRVFTGDALYCQQGLCQQVGAAGGDYLLVVKGNQPELLMDLHVLFNPPDLSVLGEPPPAWE